MRKSNSRWSPWQPVRRYSPDRCCRTVVSLMPSSYAAAATEPARMYVRRTSSCRRVGRCFAISRPSGTRRATPAAAGSRSRARIAPGTEGEPSCRYPFCLDHADTIIATPQACKRGWSGRRDSNPRHPAWKASALPTELLPLGGTRLASPECAIAVAVRAHDIALGHLRLESRSTDSAASDGSRQRVRHRIGTADQHSHPLAGLRPVGAGVERRERRSARRFDQLA